MIKILPFGDIDTADIKALCDNLPFKTEIADRIEIPEKAYDSERNQYLAEYFIEEAKRFDGRVLGVTDVDLYTYGLNFIFGEAEMNGRIAVISIFRLRNGKKTFVERMVKEAVHEIGHTIGLIHCQNPLCVMHFSNCLTDTDIKNAWYCPKCERLVKSEIEGLMK
ncbi:MAG: archaemetzincin family Zn-dependent metalloprotease [Thermoplasmatales archaeon]|nr:archaemetzincin family Zn-dependent metalloprotease [Thermoplasmatales archaeon]